MLMVAHQFDLAGPVNFGQTLNRIRAVADDVAEADHLVNLLAVNILQDCRKSGRVGVDVREKSQAHSLGALDVLESALADRDQIAVLEDAIGDFFTIDQSFPLATQIDEAVQIAFVTDLSLNAR